MPSPPPMAFRWTGVGMVPLNPRAAEQAFKLGHVYRLEPWMDRSPASVAHYFAIINEAFDNLPAPLAARLGSPESLRKYALIQCGYRDERSVVCRSKAEARRVAAFVQPFDEHAIVSVVEAMVVVWTARSQSRRTMDRETFQRSKDDVLSYIGNLTAAKAA